MCVIFLTLIFTVLILTVSRSAWIGAIIVTIGFLKVMLMDGSLKISQWDWKKFLQTLGKLIGVIIFSLVLIYAFHLTNFQLFNRAASTAGLQKITIACERELNSQKGELSSQSVVASVDELFQYGCRHINLEDIEKEHNESASCQTQSDESIGFDQVIQTSIGNN